MESKDYDYLFKTLLIGDAGSGKSSILMRYADNIFNENYFTTIGIDFKIRKITVNDKIIKMQMWDTAGQERFRTITASYYKGAHGIFIVFDTANKQSFANVKNWYTEIKKYALSDAIIMLIGTKTDLESKREVSFEEAMSVARSYNIKYIETSSLTPSNINECFGAMANEILMNFKPVEKKAEVKKEEFRIGDISKAFKKNCCSS